MPPDNDSLSKQSPGVDPAGADPQRVVESVDRETLPLDEEVASLKTLAETSAPSSSSALESQTNDDGTLYLGSNPVQALEAVDSEHYRTPELPPSPLTPGDVFLGKYRIERLIGAGGMGSVVLARHQELGAQYAIKVMHASSPDRSAVDRFKREARTSAMVEHPNIVRVFDCGEHDGHCYIIMEYLRGETLRQRLGRIGRFSLDETVRFAGVVCDVLEVMHEMGVVHRDLKPDNIVFSQRGKSENIKILDFGIAKLATSSVSDHLTQTGSIVGTPSYMSPEQCLAGQIDGRSDIYALGVILFQMVTGRLPFDSDNLLTMMYLHVNREPPSAHDIDPSVPPAVSDVIQRMMAKTPADRFQSAASCAAALSGAAGVIIPIREGIETSAALAISGAFPARISSSAQGTVARPVLQSAELEADSSSKMRRGPLAGYLAVGTLALAASAAGLWYAPSLWNSPGTNAVENSGGATNGPLDVSSVLAEHFVEIAGGTVTIGANENDCGDMDFCRIGPEETPPHTVSLSPFWIAKREVTNFEYAEFVSATGHGAPSNWRTTYPRGTDALPVTNVSWFDALAYTAWRSERDGIAYRLPTEQEWEYAARGDDARMFPWGDFWNANSVNSDQKSDKGSPLPVDQTPNNTTDVTPRGVGALAGNVCEWTSTQFEAYPGSPYKPTQGDLACKVIRGGSFNTKPNASRTTYRAWQPAEKSARDIGFRLAADASSSADGAK